MYETSNLTTKYDKPNMPHFSEGDTYAVKHMHLKHAKLPVCSGTAYR